MGFGLASVRLRDLKQVLAMNVIAGVGEKIAHRLNRAHGEPGCARGLPEEGFRAREEIERISELEATAE